MTRRLICSLVMLVAAAVSVRAETSSILQRFFSIDDPNPISYRALRHLDAENSHFDSTAWMDVWTEADARGFRYRIVGEDGSDYIRSHVFRESLKSESEMWASGAPDRAGFTTANYIFEDRGSQPDGLACLTVTPRRKDVLLVEGSIFLDPRDGDLVRLEGRLSKSPSFWARRVDIVRHYPPFAGARRRACGSRADCRGPPLSGPAASTSSATTAGSRACGCRYASSRWPACSLR